MVLKIEIKDEKHNKLNLNFYHLFITIVVFSFCTEIFFLGYK